MSNNKREFEINLMRQIYYETSNNCQTWKNNWHELVNISIKWNYITNYGNILTNNEKPYISRHVSQK
jgi:hypothetical protein